MGKTHISKGEDKEIQRREDTSKSAIPPQFALGAEPLQAKMGESKESPVNETTKSLPGDVKAQMETSMGADFSGVKVHENSKQATQMGALAYAQGQDLHFAPGTFDTSSQAGKELIGHELAHVKQQSEGKVSANGSVGGQAMNNDQKLEEQADQMSKNALAGEKSQGGTATQSKVSGGPAPVQRFKMDGADIKKYPKFAAFVQNQLSKASNDARIEKYLNKYGENEGENSRDIKSDLAWGNGPLVKPWSLSKSANSFKNGTDVLRVDRTDIEDYERNNDTRSKFHELLLESSVLNGYTQFLDDQDDKDFWGKEGKKFEEKSYGRDVNTVWDAKDARNARFTEGQFEVKCVGKSAGFGQRFKIWNAGEGNGQFVATPGTTVSVTGKKFPRWMVQIEHNEAGSDTTKGWKKSSQIVTQEGEDKWIIRSEDWSDHDNNDLVLEVRKKG